VLDLGGRTSRAVDSRDSSDIDELLDRTLSSLEIPRRKPRSDAPVTPAAAAGARPVTPAAPKPPESEPDLGPDRESEPDLAEWSGFEPPPDLAFELAREEPAGAGFDAPFEPTAVPAVTASVVPAAVPPPEPTPPEPEPTPALDADAFRTQMLPAIKRPAPAKGDGQTFGDYTLLERIAVGGMAEVWKARRRGVEGFQKTVAIKKILAHLTGSPDFVTMFIDEAKLAAQLSHANIIQIYDLGKVGDDFFIAMEFVDGRDLRSILQEGRQAHRPLPSALALMIAGSVARALDYAHRKRDFDNRELGLVHRDVSPQNVLIGYEGEIKLCDFGIVKAVVKASTTQMGALKGKLQYMSPEQAWGKPVDARSDIFSLGSVLFEMLTGHKLFTGDSEISVLDAVRECRIRRPREVAPGLGEGIERIVLKALAKRPEDRYPTAGELEEDIKSFLLGLRPVPTQSDLADYLHRLFVDAPAAPAGEPGPARPAPATPVPELTADRARGPVAEVAPELASAEQIQGFEPPSAPVRSAPSKAAARPGRPEVAMAGTPSRRGKLVALAAVVAVVVLGILAVVLWLGRKNPSEPTPPVAAPMPAAAETPALETPAGETAAGETAAGESAAGESAATETPSLPANLEDLVDEAFSSKAEEINQDFEAKKRALEKELAAAREAAQKQGGGGP